MTPNNREPQGWLGDILSGLLDAFDADALEAVYWLSRAIVHVLFIGVRVLFHLLTCHF